MKKYTEEEEANMEYGAWVVVFCIVCGGLLLGFTAAWAIAKHLGWLP